MIFCNIWWFLQIVAADVAILRRPFKVENDTVALSVQWIDSNSIPSLDQIHNYTLVLCTGSNDNITAVETLVWEEEILRFDDVIGLDNGVYYVQVYARGDEFYTIHYTEKFVIGEVEEFDMNPPPSVIHYYDETSIDELRIQTAPPFPQIGSTITKSRWTQTRPKPTGFSYTNLRSQYPEYDYTVIPLFTTSRGRNSIQPPPRIPHHYHPSSRVIPAKLREINE